MDATLSLLNLAGAIALPLWGVHMVQSGVQRGFGSDLRRSLARALSNRIRAAAAGLGVTAILQSSTATGLVTLPTKERDGPAALEISSSSDCLAPRAHRRGAECAVR
jgi:hypothetical protein